MKNVTRRDVIIGGAATLLPTPTILCAQEAGVLKILVPLAAGSATDVTARIIAQALSDKLRRSIIIDNQPVALGRAGTMSFQRNARSDGSELLLAFTSTFTLASHIFTEMPYDPFADFEPVSLLGEVSFVLIVGPAVPSEVVDVPSFVSYLKSQPGVSYGRGNTIGRILAQQFMHEAGIDRTTMTDVPYRSEPDVILALARQEMAWAFVTDTVASGQVQAGNIRALAIGTTLKSVLMPTVPMLLEELPNHTPLSSWLGLMAPKGLPRSTQVKLSEAVRGVLETKEVKDSLNRIGFVPRGSTPEGLAAFIREEARKAGTIVPLLGIPKM